QIAHETGDRISEAGTLSNLGHLLLQMNRFDDAEKILNEALTLRLIGN
ncbi:MAG: hypothetical protein CO064_08325, partial [Anaerolineae bacterium CG_4_9_14_0_8_um_filter_58_9]